MIISVKNGNNYFIIMLNMLEIDKNSMYYMYGNGNNYCIICMNNYRNIMLFKSAPFFANSCADLKLIRYISVEWQIY